MKLEQTLGFLLLFACLLAAFAMLHGKFSTEPDAESVSNAEIETLWSRYLIATDALNRISDAARDARGETDADAMKIFFKRTESILAAHRKRESAMSTKHEKEGKP